MHKDMIIEWVETLAAGTLQNRMRDRENADWRALERTQDGREIVLCVLFCLSALIPKLEIAGSTPSPDTLTVVRSPSPIPLLSSRPV